MYHCKAAKLLAAKPDNHRPKYKWYQTDQVCQKAKQNDTSTKYFFMKFHICIK